MDKIKLLEEKNLIIKIICKYNSFEDMTFKEIARYYDPEFKEDFNDTIYLILIEKRFDINVYFTIKDTNEGVRLGDFVYFSHETDELKSKIYFLPPQEVIDQYNEEVKNGSNPWMLIGFEQENLKTLNQPQAMEDYVKLYEMSKSKSIMFIAEHYQQKTEKINGNWMVEVEFSPGFYTTLVNEKGKIRIADYAYQKKPYRFFVLLPVTYQFDS
jgi:hypothetical protein